MKPLKNNENITETTSKTEFNSLKEEDITIFVALDQIIATVEGKHLNLEIVDKLNPAIPYLTKKLDLTPVQAILLAPIANCSPHITTIDDIAHFFNCTNIHVMRYAKELDSLMEKRIVRYKRTFNAEGYCVPKNVMNAFKENKVYLAEDPRLEPFTVLPYAKVIMGLIMEHKPNILMFGATMKGRELAPRVASEKLAGLTADCTDLQIDDFDDKVNKKFYKNKLMQIRPAFGGNIIATIVNSWDDPQMVTVREGVMKLGEADPSRTGELERVEVKLSDAETVVKVLERVRADKEVDLQGAQIIVAGGYGVGSKENFKLIYDLAEALVGRNFRVILYSYAEIALDHL